MHTARVFTNGNSQAVRLPKQFRLSASEVFIRKDVATGDIVLSTRPAHGDWAEFFALRAKTRLPADFLTGRPLNRVEPAHDPFASTPPAAPVRRKPASGRESAMLHLLDTDTCSYAIRSASATLDVRLATAKPDSLAISAVTRAELVFGLEKRGNPRDLSRLVHGFLDRVAVMPWDAAAADHFAKLRAQLECGGTPIGIFDTMIAGHALALKATLVTNNQKHFQKVKALKIENWLE